MPAEGSTLTSGALLTERRRGDWRCACKHLKRSGLSRGSSISRRRRSRSFSLNVATYSQQSSHPLSAWQPPRSEATRLLDVSSSPSAISSRSIPPPKALLEHGARVTRDPSRVGAARAHHAFARSLRLLRHPGAERRFYRAKRGSLSSRSCLGSGAGVIGAHGCAVQLEPGGAVETVEGRAGGSVVGAIRPATGW